MIPPLSLRTDHINSLIKGFGLPQEQINKSVEFEYEEDGQKKKGKSIFIFSPYFMLFLRDELFFAIRLYVMSKA